MASKYPDEQYRFEGKDRSHGLVTLQVEVPSTSVGRIIGAKGRQMRKIEEEANLHLHSINISRAESKPGMQIVSIKGKQSNCEAAKHKIEELVGLSMKGKPYSGSEMRHSQVSRRIHKYLSFLTFLKDTDEVVFTEYKGIRPTNWKDDKCMYFLEAPKREASMPPMEDMHHRLRNYSRLQDTLHTALEKCLSSPGHLELEARFGKVVWRSNSQHTISDEVLSGRYKIKDLEEGGKVSVDDVLGGKNTRWSFPTILSDATILESVKGADFPVIGDVDRLDITMHYQRGSVDQLYMIRTKQNREKKNFEFLEVLAKPDKPYVFDCLNLERDLDMRIAIGCSHHHPDAQLQAEIKEMATKLCHGVELRGSCLHVKEPPEECSIEYARLSKQTMYLVSHKDKVHGEYQYILAHYQVKDWTQTQQSRSPSRSKLIQLEDEHHELEMWNCQWMADFAALDEKRPEEVFIFNCCDPSKIKVRPKDRSKVTADSVIRELDPFVACALELALIDRD